MSDLKPRSLLAKPGFTIVEMVIIAPIVILMIGAFVTVIVNLTGEVLASRSANVLAFNTQDALSRIEADVRLSTKFLAVNNITLTSPQGYDNATGVFQNASATNGNMLILEQPMTAGNPATSAGTALVRKDASLPCSDPNVNSLNTFMTMNVVYFVKTDVNNVSTLWRRTVVPSDYITNSCYTAPVTKPWQQPSCLTGTGGVCLTQDVRLLDGITAANFNVQYFNQSSDTVANTVASDSAALDADRNAALQSTTAVGVTLSVTKTAAGRDIGQTGTIRATRLNGGFVSTAPANLAAIAGPTRVSLTWTAPTNNGGSAITGYKLYRGTTANPTTLVQTLGNVTSYNDTGLVAGTTYYYRVIAINNTGDSPYSVQASATPTVYVPFSLTLNQTGTGQTGTIQTWTVPATGTYTIEVWGAQGGSATGSASALGGFGARMKGDFALTVGQVVKILVGQMGIGNVNDSGGGGGTFVQNQTSSTLLIAAGGGGGASYYSGYIHPGVNGTTATSGTLGTGSGAGTPGSGGSGGSGSYGASGGGYTSNGTSAVSYSGAGGGLSFTNGGTGGAGITAPIVGGFGGGGGAHGNSCIGGGGGGGYSGGTGTLSSCGNAEPAGGGGGGGSYNSGTNQSNTAGARTGQGLVTINN